MAPTLTMPLFVAPADVILRMQLGADLAGIDEVVSSGIIGAQLYLEQLLRGKLQRRSHDVKYRLDSDAFSGIQKDGVFRVELPSPFIREDTAVVVTTCATMFGTYDTADDTLYVVDYERGYLLMDKDEFKDRHIRVQCDSGFEDGTNYDTASPPALIPMEQIPNDLYEAIMSLVPVIFDGSQTTNRNAEAKSQYQNACDHAAVLVQPFMRVQGFTFRAI